MIGAIEGTAGITITTVMGKPSVLTALTALDILGVKAEDCLMSGDRLETDIKMGNQAGMSTALVLTGVSTKEDLMDSSVKPTYVLNSVHDIYLSGTALQQANEAQ